jgi:hypothetical protein
LVAEFTMKAPDLKLKACFRNRACEQSSVKIGRPHKKAFDHKNS